MMLGEFAGECSEIAKCCCNDCQNILGVVV